LSKFGNSDARPLLRPAINVRSATAVSIGRPVNLHRLDGERPRVRHLVTSTANLNYYDFEVIVPKTCPDLLSCTMFE